MQQKQKQQETRDGIIHDGVLTLEDFGEEDTIIPVPLTPLPWMEDHKQSDIPWKEREFENHPIPDDCTCRKMYNWYIPRPCICTEDMKKRNKVCSSCHATQLRSCHRNCGTDALPIYTIEQINDVIPMMPILANTEDVTPIFTHTELPVYTEFGMSIL